MKRVGVRSEAMVAILVSALTFSAFPLHAIDNNHVVSQSEMLDLLEQASETRAENIETIRRALAEHLDGSAPTAMSTEKIEDAVAFLSDEELARLSARSEEFSGDISGTGLSNTQIWLIVIGGSAALLILTIIAINDVNDAYTDDFNSR